MWFLAPSPDSLARPRVAVAVISVVVAASVGYYIYHQTIPDPFDYSSGGLHRSNAIRRPRRRSRRRVPPPSPGASVTSEEDDPVEVLDVNSIPTLNDGDTVVESSNQAAEWYNNPALVTQQRAGHNLVTLLFRVSEDNSRRNACIHRGCQCNNCNTVPIRGIRYRCANCADFDLCETCESQGLHTKTHVFYKIKVPAPPSGLRQMQSVWYTGDPENCIKYLPKSLVTKLCEETGFERPEVEAYWEQWTYMANNEWRDDPDELFLAMDRKTFERCLVPSAGSRHTAPNLIHDRMFSFYDTNGDGLISFTEFLHGLAYRNRKDKLKKVFDGYDIDGDGYVDRRDFLRIFRAYYVLFKQMHRDVLDGLDEQVMASCEAQQLVHSRQPLSGLFGREGNIPQADLNHHRLSGKTYQPNGHVELPPTRVNVLGDERGDTAPRERILAKLYSNGSMRTRELSPADSVEANIASRYVEGLFSGSLEGLSGILSAVQYNGTQIFPPLQNGAEEQDGLTHGSASSDSLESYDTDQENTASVTSPERSLERVTNGVGQEWANGEPGENSTLADLRFYRATMPTESQLRQHVLRKMEQEASEAEKQERIRARRKLHERWKRRQFYLDEEEGAVPPEGWEADEDILANISAMASSSKAAAQRVPLSPRSRSSSKVRFVEEADDYDVRSNPSTSSRSVPERWGGMEIPDIERDAGKEILYQVAQEAFNELLDILFKKREELAVRAAKTKEERLKYHDQILEASREDEDGTIPEEDPYIIHHTNRHSQAAESIKDGSETRLEDRLESLEEDIAVESDEPFSDEDATAALEDEALHRDPTMPQFRPNSLPQPHVIQSRPAPPSSVPLPRTSSLTNRSSSSPERLSEKAKGKKPADTHLTSKGSVRWCTLVKWNKLNRAVAEAEERGGFGKISFEEFEKIHKKQEAMGNRLDYLGSWIDFCIP